MATPSVQTQRTSPFSKGCNCTASVLRGATFIGLKGGVMFKLNYCPSCAAAGGPVSANDDAPIRR